MSRRSPVAGSILIHTRRGLRDGKGGTMETMTIDYAVTNPATGEQLKVYPTITDDELQAAIALANETHRNWLRSSTVEERAKLVRRVGELHSERREQLAEIATREMGKPLKHALGEVDFCVDIY